MSLLYVKILPQASSSGLMAALKTWSLAWSLHPRFSCPNCCCSVMPDSSWPHELQHFMLRCPSLSPGICSNSCPLSWWCLQPSHPGAHFSSCPQSFPSSVSFPMSRLSASGGHSNVLTPLVLFFLRSPCYLLPQNLCTYSSLSGLPPSHSPINSDSSSDP